MASVYRRCEITRKNNAGSKWHSMYMGTSLLPLPFSQEKIYKFFEPALVFGAGHMLWAFSGQVGLWLMIAAVSLFINNHIVLLQRAPRHARHARRPDRSEIPERGALRQARERNRRLRGRRIQHQAHAARMRGLRKPSAISPPN